MRLSKPGDDQPHGVAGGSSQNQPHGTAGAGGIGNTYYSQAWSDKVHERQPAPAERIGWGIGVTAIITVLIVSLLAVVAAMLLGVYLLGRTAGVWT